MAQDAGLGADLYEKAIHHARKIFEPGENQWRNIPNRPFMPAAFAYGAHLFSEGDYHEAVALLIHAGRYNEAAEIMVRYEKGSNHDSTYLYLDWKLELEASKGESMEADDVLKQAAKARYIWLLLNGMNR